MYNLDEIKQVPIASIVDVSGGKRVSGGWLIKSPLRQERTASFHIDCGRNLWHDFGSGEGGDVIRLAQLLWGCSFAEALQRLGGEEATPTTRRAPIPPRAASPTRVAPTPAAPTRVDFSLSFPTPAMVRYAASRGVAAEVVSAECLCGGYTYKGRRYECLAFANDKGGYELRGKGSFKACDGHKAISTRLAEHSAAVVLIEGFFDYLSWRQIEADAGKDGINVIVLNSVALWAQAAAAVKEKGWGRVYLCLDLDKAGDDATAKLLEALPTAQDVRKTALNGHKDLNERLQSEAQERAAWRLESAKKQFLSASTHTNEWTGGVEKETGFFYFHRWDDGSHISAYRREQLNHYEVWDAQNQRWGAADIDAATPPDDVARAVREETKKSGCRATAFPKASPDADRVKNHLINSTPQR